jgi:hypothetical protein
MVKGGIEVDEWMNGNKKDCVVGDGCDKTKSHGKEVDKMDYKYS